MKTLKHFLVRFLIIVVPLAGLYFYAQMAFEANSQREHPTDAGLGIAYLLLFFLFILFVGFLFDFIIKFRTKQFKIVWIDLSFLLIFTISIIYLVCLMTSRDCFCSWIIETIGKLW